MTRGCLQTQVSLHFLRCCDVIAGDAWLPQEEMLREEEMLGPEEALDADAPLKV